MVRGAVRFTEKARLELEEDALEPDQEEHVMTQPSSRVRCPSCGKLAMQRVSRSIRTKVGKRSISVPNVEIEECAHCGERLYDLRALSIIRRAREPARRGSAA